MVVCEVVVRPRDVVEAAGALGGEGERLGVVVGLGLVWVFAEGGGEEGECEEESREEIREVHGCVGICG